jgi:periplasmic divalent cation tolerance protein
VSTRNSPKAALIYTALPDAATAREIAGSLLDERLIACANILGPMESVFVWDGRRDSASETAVLFKTDERRMAAAVDRLGALHPYDTPAIVGWLCEEAHAATLGWLAGQLD